MSFNKKTKLTFRVTLIAFNILLAFILLNFIIHVVRTQNFNSTIRTLDNYSQTTDVLVDIHPRGLATDSWEKTDAYPNKIIYAKIYEATISNNSKSNLKDWALRVDITQDCWINNAWNGKIEIHQFRNQGEIVQKLSLQNYSESDLVLEHEIKGQDLLIPLSDGDYFIYYPCDEDSISEEIIESNEYFNGTMSVGFIFYSESGDVNLSNYELTYRLEKNIWKGKETVIFLIMLPAWILALIIIFSISVFLKRYEKTLGRQSTITREFLETFADFVDSKNTNKKNHSRGVAECAKKIAKKLGMKKQDVESVYYAALVHDIGECYIADYLLKKTEDLSRDEIEIIKQHTVKGAEMLRNVTSIPHLQDGAMYHHEMYDGTGYPTGKAGEDIPLIGRIVCVADCVAETEASMVRADFPKDEKIQQLREGKGTKFDPMLVDIMIEIIREIDVEKWEQEDNE